MVGTFAAGDGEGLAISFDLLTRGVAALLAAKRRRDMIKRYPGLNILKL